MRCLIVVLTLFTIHASASSALAKQLPSLEEAAEKIQNATVTIRVVPTSVPRDDNAEPQVTVFSGVSLGNGLLVTPVFATSDVQVRITIPGGEQATAQPLVADQHSGLMLLEMSNKDIPKLELAESMPRVGAWIVSAAAWGAEKPVVSFGIVGGLDRSPPGGNYPPLLRCNITTAETSTGAGIVDRNGELVGLIVAADPPNERGGWAYAVPATHVERLLRANEQRREDPEQGETVLHLPRRRAEVGMTLSGQPNEIKVIRTRQDGPAWRAGIQVGDRVVAADGFKIRSVYEAYRPVSMKQPGDVVSFRVQRAGKELTYKVVLDGGIVVPGVQSNLFQPKVVVGGLSNRFQMPAQADTVQELAAPPTPKVLTLPAERDLKDEALDRYRTAISILRGQVLQLEQQLGQLRTENESYKATNQQLRRQVTELRQNAPE